MLLEIVFLKDLDLWIRWFFTESIPWDSSPWKTTILGGNIFSQPPNSRKSKKMSPEISEICITNAPQEITSCIMPYRIHVWCVHPMGYRFEWPIPIHTGYLKKVFGVDSLESLRDGSPTTLPETNSKSTWKCMVGRWVPFWDSATWQVRAVSLRECKRGSDWFAAEFSRFVRNLCKQKTRKKIITCRSDETPGIYWLMVQEKTTRKFQIPSCSNLFHDELGLGARCHLSIEL